MLDILDHPSIRFSLHGHDFHVETGCRSRPEKHSNDDCLLERDNGRYPDRIVRFPKRLPFLGASDHYLARLLNARVGALRHGGKRNQHLEHHDRNEHPVSRGGRPES